MIFLNWLNEIGVFGFFDIAFMATLIYILLIWFKKTRAATVFIGIIIIGILYLLARQFNLVMMATVFENFFTVIILALIIIFRDELRQFFEKIADWSIQRKHLINRQNLVLPEVKTLVLTLTDFAKEKTGALIVLKGKDNLSSHITGGIVLNASLNEPILKSIFDPHSVGHDGAIIIDGHTITHFMAHLPLSRNLSELGHKGTRHAAALGLSEYCDALCLVASEERGHIMLAQQGRFELVSDSGRLTQAIDNFYSENAPKLKFSLWHDIIRVNFWTKIIALLISLAMWFVLVQGAKITTYNVPVKTTIPAIPSPWQLSTIEPDTINVTFKAPRRSFYFFSKKKVQLLLQPKLESNKQILHIMSTDLDYPKGLILENITPSQITLQLLNRTTDIK